MVEVAATLAQGLWQWVSHWCTYSWPGCNWIHVAGRVNCEDCTYIHYKVSVSNNQVH